MDAEKLLQAFTKDETQELVAVLPADVLIGEVTRRGLELPLATGVVAVEGAVRSETAEAQTENGL